jgi:hypothetical protein
MFKIPRLGQMLIVNTLFKTLKGRFVKSSSFGRRCGLSKCFSNSWVQPTRWLITVKPTLLQKRLLERWREPSLITSGTERIFAPFLLRGSVNVETNVHFGK